MSNCTECDREGTNQTAAQSFPAYIAAIMLSMSSIIVLTNISVLIIFLWSKSLRGNRHHNLVICLSISDLALGLSSVVGSFRLLIPAWSGAIIPCIISVVLIAVAVFMSLFQTFFISFHRFLVAVESPWNDRLFQRKRKYVIYILSWSSVLVWTFALVRPKSKNDVNFCNIMVIYGENFPIFSRVYGVQAMVLLISTILLYIFTVRSVRKRYMTTFAWQVENGQSDEGHAKTENPSNEHSRNIIEIGKRRVFESLKVVGIIITLLVLFTGPFVILMFSTVFNLIPSYCSLFVVCALTNVNSVLNPFVYCWKIDSFRKEFKLFFRMCLQDQTMST